MPMLNRTPPEISGNTKKDISRLRQWCEQLVKRLSAMLCRIENKQIVSVSADKITSGRIEFNGGGFIEITADGVILSNSAGTQYIKLENDTITIKAIIEGE